MKYKVGDKIIRTGADYEHLGMYNGRVYTFERYYNIDQNRIFVREIKDKHWGGEYFELVKPNRKSHFPNWF